MNAHKTYVLPFIRAFDSSTYAPFYHMIQDSEPRLYIKIKANSVQGAAAIATVMGEDYVVRWLFVPLEQEDLNVSYDCDQGELRDWSLDPMDLLTYTKKRFPKPEKDIVRGQIPQNAINRLKANALLLQPCSKGNEVF
ncbi:hypothetical protein VNO77_35064 [Canavalia gladiata]|uniref:Uncharacterized protein n=1 Tax=Canavalia gladiata TaxID=3824 RepID=A0AAN9KH87_CANGL